MTDSGEIPEYVLDFAQITLKDLPRVGGKNASLGELFRALEPKGVGVLDGFATTAGAYRRLLAAGDLETTLRSIFDRFDAENLDELSGDPRNPCVDTAIWQSDGRGPPDLSGRSRPREPTDRTDVSAT